MHKIIINTINNPQSVFFKLWGIFNFGSFSTRLEYDIFPRPHYAFCMYYAARDAYKLGYKRISVVEFGVAGGLGLIQLERIATEVEQEFPIKIDIYGFDTGEGLPDPVDYRDLPYIWQPGFYKMDQEKLRQKLKRSKLILGNVKETAPFFFKKYNSAPLAAAFFDLDYYSSTIDSFKIFETEFENQLPRIFCYCDDIISSESGGLMSEYVGQLAAINAYNESNSMRKIAKASGLELTRRRMAKWNHQIYIHHCFEHPNYNKYIHNDKDRQLKLK